MMIVKAIPTSNDNLVLVTNTRVIINQDRSIEYLNYNDLEEYSTLSDIKTWIDLNYEDVYSIELIEELNSSSLMYYWSNLKKKWYVKGYITGKDELL